MTRKGQIFLGFLVGTLLSLALVTSAEVLRRRRLQQIAEQEATEGEQ